MLRTPCFHDHVEPLYSHYTHFFKDKSITYHVAHHFQGVGWDTDWKQSKHVRKNNFSELEKLILCKATVFFKLLGKTMFHVPKSTRIGLGTWNIVFLNSLKKTQALQKNNFSSSEKLFFFRACLDCSQSTQKPIPAYWFLRGLWAVQACAKKTIFRSLKNCFSAKPPFSSSYWGKQCFRSPSLPTCGFWVDWKQSKHARKNQFVGAWKIVCLQSPISSRKTIQGVTPKKWTAKGNCKPHV